MFDHVTIRATDPAASQRFYDLVLRAAGIRRTASGDEFVEWDDFSLAPATPDRPATRRLHIGFGVPSREHVDAFWRAGIEAGHRDDGAPGPRPQYTPGYYGAFLLDPDGNSAEAAHHEHTRADGNVDHLWIRVADVPAAARFYETIAPHAGLRADGMTAGIATFRRAGAGGGTFSLVAGTPTEHVHIAFPAAGDDAVRAFHAAATRAGHPDDGPPGERPEYHPGYYAAFVRDPAGNGIEVVNHNR